MQVTLRLRLYVIMLAWIGPFPSFLLSLDGFDVAFVRRSVRCRPRNSFIMNASLTPNFLTSNFSPQSSFHSSIFLLCHIYFIFFSFNRAIQLQETAALNAGENHKRRKMLKSHQVVQIIIML